MICIYTHASNTLYGVRVVYSLVFYVVSCVLLFVCLSFLAMALSVCFRFMNLTVPLVSFVPLLWVIVFLKENWHLILRELKSF